MVELEGNKMVVVNTAIVMGEGREISVLEAYESTERMENPTLYLTTNDF